jgi:hypothetical protein
MRVAKSENYTAKTQYRKFETNIPRKRIPGLSGNFLYIHVSLSYLHTVLPRSVCLFCRRKICGPILCFVYI